MAHLADIGAGSRKMPCLENAVDAPFIPKQPQSDRSFAGTFAGYDRACGGSDAVCDAVAAFPLGVISAMKNGRWQDRIITFLTLLGISAPSFFMAVLIIRVFAVDLGPWTGLQSSGYLWEEEIFGDGYGMRLSNLLLPALALECALCRSSHSSHAQA